MKFQFKEGQWFDVRKLTDWQKQWCLENLEFLPTTEVDFKEEDFNFWMYSVWTGIGDVFCSASDHCCEPENEITFNDFYWEDEEVSQESLFDNPRWVTVKGNDGDTTSFFGYQLICGKDYKVVNKSDGGNDIQLTPTKVIEVAEEYFHKVTPQDLLPEEVEDSFDNLVYVEPKYIDNDTYYVVEKGKLSEDQWEFLLSNLPTEEECLGDELFLNLSPRTRKWFDEDEKSRSQDIYISFNDIFQEVN